MLLPKMFCENEKEALSEMVPPDSMAATNGPIKAQINAEVVEYYTFGQCKYLLQSQKFFYETVNELSTVCSMDFFLFFSTIMASVLLVFLIHAFDWFYASFLRIHFRDLEHTEKNDFLRFLEIKERCRSQLCIPQTP